jgi:predicted  nucleic acid-binding Zn-ribbon protein
MARGPVGHTCPDIDAVINGISYAMSDLRGLESILESLRSDNDALRTWGSEWENKANDTISDLQSDLKDAKEQIESLKTKHDELKEELERHKLSNY